MENRRRKTMLWVLGCAAIFVVLIKIRSGEFDFFGSLALLAFVVLGAALFMPPHWVHVASGIGMLLFFPVAGLVTGRVPTLKRWGEGVPFITIDEQGYWIMIAVWFLASAGVIWFGVRVIKRHNAGVRS